MIVDYLSAALERATYEIIEDEEPYYGEVPGIEGVWATGETLEACRRELARAVEDWILFSVHRGASVPPLGDVVLELPRKVG